MTAPKEAICTRELLHNWNIVTQYKDGQVEVCSFCHEKMSWHYDRNGRVKNILYYNTHFRDYLQPRGGMLELYKKCYPKETRKLFETWEKEKTRKSLVKRPEDVVEEVKEELRYYSKYASKDMFL